MEDDRLRTWLKPGPVPGKGLFGSSFSRSDEGFSGTQLPRGYTTAGVRDLQIDLQRLSAARAERPCSEESSLGWLGIH